MIKPLVIVKEFEEDDVTVENNKESATLEVHN